MFGRRKPRDEYEDYARARVESEGDLDGKFSEAVAQDGKDIVFKFGDSSGPKRTDEKPEFTFGDFPGLEKRGESEEPESQSQFGELAEFFGDSVSKKEPVVSKKEEAKEVKMERNDPIKVSALVYPIDGPRRAYRYWDHIQREWFLTLDRTAASQAGNGVYEESWIFIKGNKFDHEMTPEEIRKYLP